MVVEEDEDKQPTASVTVSWPRTGLHSSCVFWKAQVEPVLQSCRAKIITNPAQILFGSGFGPNQGRSCCNTRFDYAMGPDSCRLFNIRGAHTLLNFWRLCTTETPSGVGQSTRELHSYCMEAGFAHILINCWRFWRKKNESGLAWEASGTVPAGSRARCIFFNGGRLMYIACYKGLLICHSIPGGFAEKTPVGSRTEYPRIALLLPGSRVCLYFNYLILDGCDQRKMSLG